MAPSSNDHQHLYGVALCAASAVGFGLMAIFAKEAYAAGVGVGTLLVVRFVLAASAFWAVVVARRPAWPPRRVVLAGLGMGAILYTAQSGLYFTALTRIDASLAALLLYTFPALVFLGALALGRERPERRRLAALTLAGAGAILVLGGSGSGDADGLGIALGLGAALAYATYILVADGVVGRIDPFLLSALIATGAAGSFSGYSAVSGDLALGFEPIGWLWIAGVVAFSTVLALSLFLIGLPKVGPSTASIVSTIEPLVTVGLAMAILGERLGPVQALGGTLVLAAVVLLARRAAPPRVGVAARVMA